MRMISIGALAALTLFAVGAAAAATEHFSATLKGAEETPATDSKGTGKVDATLDTTTKAFSYTATYSGLSGPAVAAHFHGPAAPGASGPPVVPVPKSALTSPMKGKATLTDAQVKDLEAGQWYFNVHTAANPGGEIRGQVTKAK
jgi:hypothetical protein